MLDSPTLTFADQWVIRAAKRFGFIDRITPAGRTLGRREAFADFDEALRYFGGKSLFRRFDPDCLADYVRHGLAANGQGLRLKFDPATEISIYRNVPHAAPGSPRRLAVPLALVRGPCAYRGAALAALEQNGMRWKCIVTCTSLQGVFAVVRAGLAVAVVTEGDIGSGVKASPAGSFLPPLPGSSLTIRYADKQPTLAARALARTMGDVLTQMAREAAPQP